MSAAATILPWHDSLWAQLRKSWREQRWPHALLIHGPEGVGKNILARRLANALLCDRPTATWDACGTCASCQLLKAQTHPDLSLIAPEEDKQSISIDQIRDLCARLAFTSYRHGHKVAIVTPAQQMTTAAANSLLKTLEEPAPNTTLILVSNRLGALLPTLRSRCQLLAVRAPSIEQGMGWLAAQTSNVDRQLLRFANGAPLRALALAEGRYSTLRTELDSDLESLFNGKLDVTHIAKRWSGDDLPDRLAHLDGWLCTKLRQAIVGIDDPITGTPLPSAAPQLNISRLYACLDKTRALAAQLTRTALQRELALAALLIELMDAYAGRTQPQVA